MVYQFGDPIVIMNPIIRGKLVVGPFSIKEGTTMSKTDYSASKYEVNKESLETCIEETKWDPALSHVSFFDDLSDLADYYSTKQENYTNAEEIRMSGELKEINTDEMTFVVEVNPKAIFKPAQTEGVTYNLYPRAYVEWDGTKIVFKKIFCYDLVALPQED